MYLQRLYRECGPDVTDLYQITMAGGFVGEGMAEMPASFTYYFRTLPFEGGYAISAGLGAVVEWLQHWQFTDDIVDFLQTIPGNDGKPILSPEVCKVLAGTRLTVDIDAIPEGRLVFPFEPIVRVTGPLLQCQLIETALLCLMNFQTLIATKAARIREVAGNDVVLEFGLRRAQGFDGALSATRAAYIGGCNGTSNVLAGRLLGVPVKGTHAHSWVMSFPSELEAFMAYVRQYPNNAILLVDTYDTRQGVLNAIEAGKWLREHGHDLAGIRLDSGDLAKLSKTARELLDQAGFTKTLIVASNDLDEFLVQDLKGPQGAKINAWGIGTKLVTGAEQSALGGVYKLTAIDRGKGWEFGIKRSENPVKISIPGMLNVRRYSDADGMYIGDMICDGEEAADASKLFEVANPMVWRALAGEVVGEELLLQPLMRQGKLVTYVPDLLELQKTVRAELKRLPEEKRRLINPDVYPVGLSKPLSLRRLQMLMDA